MATRSARNVLMTWGPKTRRAILLILVVGVPLLFLRILNDPINVPKLGLLMIGVSIAGAIRLAEALQERDVGGLRLLVLPAAAISLPLTVAWVFSPYRGWALWGSYPRFLGLLPYLFVVIFGVLLADAFRSRPLQVAWALLAAGAASGTYALIQFVGLDPFAWSLKGDETSGLVVGTLGNSNFAGAFFAIVIPVGTALLVVDHEHRWWALGLTAATAGGWAAAGSQAAWAAGVVGLLVMTSLGLGSSTRVRVAGLVAAAAIALAVVGAVAASAAGLGDSAIPLTIQRRAEWWQAAASMAKTSPIVGRGPNSFAIEHPRHRTVEDVRQSGLDITDDPHSVVMSFVTAAGFLGLGGYLIAIGWGIRRAVSVRMGDLPGAAFAGALAAYLVQSWVSIDTVALRVAGWTALAGLAAAAAPGTATVPRGRKKRETRRSLRAVPAVVTTGLVGLVGVWAGANLMLADARFRHAGALVREGEGDAAVAAYERAIAFSGNIDYRRAFGNLLGRVAVGAGESGQQFIVRAHEAFSFVEDVPHVNSLIDYARVMHAWSQVEPDAAWESLDLYLRAVSHDPLDGLLLLEASDVALEEAEYEAVVGMLQPLPDQLYTGPLWGNLALAEAKLGHEDEARLALDQALLLAPTDQSATEAAAILEEQSAPE